MSAGGLDGRAKYRRFGQHIDVATSVMILQHGEKLAQPGDPGLTEKGRHQAALAAAVLCDLTPGAVVCSPLRRARETAAPLASRCRLPIEIDARVSERINLSPGQDPMSFAHDWERSVQNRAWKAAEGRSSLAPAADMRQAIEEHVVADRVLVVVGHGGASIDLLRDLLGDAELERRAPGIIGYGMPGGAITHLSRTTNGWQLLGIGSVDHIPLSSRTGHSLI